MSSAKSTRIHSNKSNSLSSSPSRRQTTRHPSPELTDSILARIMPRPTPIKSTTTTAIHTRQTSHSPAAKSQFDGLPRAARSVSLQPTPRPHSHSKKPTQAPVASSSSNAASTATETSDGTRHHKFETLAFTPEHEKFGYIIRPRSSQGDCPDMSRSSSIISFNRSSLFTPSDRHHNTDCISYFPPYVGSDMHNEDEEEEVVEETTQEENEEGRESNHSRGSSLSAFASAIINVFRLSPKRNTIALPDTTSDDIKTDGNQTATGPKGPIKLVPIPTAEWPCGSVRDKRRRDNIEEDGENMMLYPVKREGPRNKDDPEPVELEESSETVEPGGIDQELQEPKPEEPPAETRSQLLVDLSLQPQRPRERRHPMQSPPEIGLPPRSIVVHDPFQYIEYETPEEPSAMPTPNRPASPTVQERVEATKAKLTKLKIKLARDPIEVIHKGIDPAHIPTVHRVHRTRSHTRSQTQDEYFGESPAGPSGPRTREEYYGVSYRSSSRPSTSSSRNRDDDDSVGSNSRPSSRSSGRHEEEEYINLPRQSFTRSNSRRLTLSISPSKLYTNYLSPQSSSSSLAPPRRPSSPTPSLSSIVTPTPSESGADDMEDPEQTPKAGRGGWIALQDAT